jgi:hypothetical protein
MDKPVRISYKSEAVQPHKNLTEVVDDFEISDAGGYNYLFYETETPNMLIGKVSKIYFQQFNDIFPDAIFDPAFPAICARNFIDDESSTFERIYIQKLYTDSSISKRTVLVLDFIRHHNEIPSDILIMQNSIDTFLNEIKELAKVPK